MNELLTKLKQDYKTTLWGFIGAIVIGLGQYISTGQVTWEGALAATLILIKGYISADSKVSK